MPSQETIKKLERAAGNAFDRALKARGLSGEHYVEVYHLEEDLFESLMENTDSLNINRN